jgi:hypothetical protein
MKRSFSRGIASFLLFTGSIALGSVMLSGCDDKPSPKLAPSADKLDAPKATSATAHKFEVQKAGSKVEFFMHAPIEQITGKMNDASTGEIVDVDLADITKTKAKIVVDINGIVLFQRRKEKAEDKDFGEEKKNDTQNEHARSWLEINDENPKHEVNRRVEFSITQVKTDTPDVTKLSGDERTVKATVSGDFLLHGHKTTKTADVEITFKMKDNKPVSMRIKTAKPFAVGLEENDVKPRDTVGKLLEKGLSALSEKVAKEAHVNIDITANVSGGGASTPATATPTATGAESAAAPSATTSATAAPSASAAAKPAASQPKKSGY